MAIPSSQSARLPSTALAQVNPVHMSYSSHQQQCACFCKLACDCAHVASCQEISGAVGGASDPCAGQRSMPAVVSVEEAGAWPNPVRANARLGVQVHHWSYKKLKARNPNGPFGGYTRILQCEEPDDLMHMVPTVRVNRLSDEFADGYTPVSRPWAFTQWLVRARVPERYVFLSDPDYIFKAPPPLLATVDRPYSFPYGYLDCMQEHRRPHCEKAVYNPNGVAAADIPKVTAPIRRSGWCSVALGAALAHPLSLPARVATANAVQCFRSARVHRMHAKPQECHLLTSILALM